jgi:FkbM family methyltransferase
VINHAAIGKESGTVQFHPARDPTASSILPSDTPGVKVTLVSLDDYVRQGGLACVDAIKIDVEGAERDVIEGAKWVLTKFRPRLIYVECDCGENETPIRERLTACGYSVTRPEFQRLHPHLVARRD